MKPTILVDCDDVLVDLCTAWLNKLNEIYGTNYKASDAPDWDMTGMFDGINREDLFKPLHKAEIWHKVKPIDDSITYLRALYNEGYEIYVVTATDYRNVKFKVGNTIAKYFPFIDEKHTIICHNKQLVGDNNCILVDDYINNLIGGKYKKILFDRPHNKSVSIENTDIKKVYNWQECYELIHRITEEL